MKNSKVAVVILNWNGRKYLEQFLPVVVDTIDEDVHVVVADNASTDDSVIYLKEHYPQMQQILLDKNYGFAEGYNRALKQVEATYYVLLNSDVEVTKDWLRPMISLLDGNSRIAACQPKLLSYTNKGMFEYAGAAGGWIDYLGYPFAKGRVFDLCEQNLGQYEISEPVFWASGAALFIRSDVYWEVGGLDAYFFAHQEEIDLCWRIQAAGYWVYSCPESVVYHVGGGTLTKENPRKTYLNFRNNLIMLTKNYPVSRLLWTIPLRLCLDGLAALKSAADGNWRTIGAVIKAHFGYYKWWINGRSKSVFPKKRTVPEYGFLRKLLIGQYFLLNRKTFSEIIKK